jgi:hypothetical protein
VERPIDEELPGWLRARISSPEEFAALREVALRRLDGDTTAPAVAEPLDAYIERLQADAAVA